MHFDTSTLTLPEALAIAQADARACVADAAAQSGLASPDVVAGETISVDADRLTAAVANDVPFGAAAVAVASGRRADRASDRASDRADRAHLASSSHAASSPASTRRLLASYEFLYSESTPEMALRCVVRAREMDPVSALRVGLHGAELVAGAPAITDPALARPGAGAADAAPPSRARPDLRREERLEPRRVRRANVARYLGRLPRRRAVPRIRGSRRGDARRRVGGRDRADDAAEPVGVPREEEPSVPEPARVNLYASALELRTGRTTRGGGGGGPASRRKEADSPRAPARRRARERGSRGLRARARLGACETWPAGRGCATRTRASGRPRGRSQA